MATGEEAEDTAPDKEAQEEQTEAEEESLNIYTVYVRRMCISMIITVCTFSEADCMGFVNPDIGPWTDTASCTPRSGGFQIVAALDLLHQIDPWNEQ